MSTRPDGGRSFIVPRGASLKAAALLVLAAAGALGASSAACASDDGLYLGWMDRSVAPGADFFRFANGGWIKTHPIPPDRSYWGVDTILEQENQTFIRDLVESLGKEDWPAGTSQRKVADFYLSGMDERAIEAAGAGPLEPERSARRSTSRRRSRICRRSAYPRRCRSGKCRISTTVRG
jgi:hypothetical protein